VVTTEFESQAGDIFNLAHRMKLTGINQLWVADIHVHPAEKPSLSI